jgi:1,4-alpha-glucan branching enzyme
MRKLCIAILFTGLLVSCTTQGPSPGSDVARYEDGKLYLKISRDWDQKTCQSYADLYGIDSMTLKTILSGAKLTETDSSVWHHGKIEKDFTEIWKNMFADSLKEPDFTNVFMFEDKWVRREELAVKQDVIWGVNYFSNSWAFHCSDSVVTFSLKTNRNVGQVLVAGSFNGWSTMSTALEEKEKGVWEVKVKIAPGKIWYKYIVDGKWRVDPSNRLKERIEDHGIVSAAYVTNHTFELRGYPKARRVAVTGNFYNWEITGVEMKLTDDKWQLPVYLKAGTYSYKFVADGKWLADPENNDNREDASGNVNSFISTGEKTLFRLNGYKDREKVVLSGSFNNWSRNELVMQKDSEGWALLYAAGPGMWEYKFIADGQWLTDPDNPFNTGSGQYVNSVKVINGNHVFTLDGYPTAKNVIVTGSFNNWSRDDYRMVKTDGKWIFPAYLPVGKHLYKFIVDGNWITDPGNESVEDNQYGTGNSVLWIE